MENAIWHRQIEGTLYRKSTVDQETEEKTIGVISHQINASENHQKVLLHTHWNSWVIKGIE